MNALFKKLNFKNQPSVLLVNPPEGFEKFLAELPEDTIIVKKTYELKHIAFALVFVTRQEEIETAISEITPLLIDDAILWFSYPKKTSKKYVCNFNRDTGWESLGKYNFEPVRQVAIDEDWSALRFRNVNKIKKITRRESYALTKEAKNRTTKKGK